jgi:hypothetical protein
LAKALAVVVTSPGRVEWVRPREVDNRVPGREASRGNRAGVEQATERVAVMQALAGNPDRCLPTMAPGMVENGTMKTSTLRSVLAVRVVSRWMCPVIPVLGFRVAQRETLRIIPMAIQLFLTMKYGEIITTL